MGGPTPGPAIARALLSKDLRTLRDDRPASDVARAMHWSLSKLNRIENGKVTIGPVEVEALARHYGVDDAEELRRLVRLSVTSRQRMWWRDEHFAEDFTNFIAFEHDASHLYGYQATFIPPLLQIPEYALAVTSSVLRRPTRDRQVRNIVDVRLKRQESLWQRLDGDFPPSLSQVIDEAVLLRPVGGGDVMTAQLDHLAAMAKRPGIRIVVLPLRLGVHPGLGGTFELLTFTEDDDLDVVFIETPASDFLLTDREDTATFREITTELLDTDPSGDSLHRALTAAKATLRS
ncbi:transcriptional regulator [Actinoplanes capillaceus]|uniref:Transcriptional regulator n=1 Tax=Actinoplanes campanulatus TaxID=113559 RepID=A0ABQ3WTX3_9ACTN|nr:helix-turn-helix transcriptional regulator [Actinoplanes capillaceus]GID49714.1 transcriptional regulator [Actinoplanes capillaceus]